MIQCGYRDLLRSDFDRKYEVIERHEVCYVPVTSVVEEAFVLSLSYNEFKKRLKWEQLPLNPDDNRSKIYLDRIDFSFSGRQNGQKLAVGTSIEDGKKEEEEKEEQEFEETKNKDTKTKTKKTSKKGKNDYQRSTKKKMRRVYFVRESFSSEEMRRFALRESKAATLFPGGFCSSENAKKKNQSYYQRRTKTKSKTKKNGGRNGGFTPPAVKLNESWKERFSKTI